MKILSLAVAAALVAAPAISEIIKVPATGDVGATMDALEAAVDQAGATVFARVDHAGGAQSAGLELAASQLLVFGNPKLGTPAMQDDPRAGLLLPLRVLVYEDGEGKVWLAYERPEDMLGALDIAPDAPYLGMMSGALAKLTAAAAGS
ncbi:DUF302 domain-containing protein [Tropicimonas isoalkanivorans]|uniref:DUF302 domain-containing protein n=1 Tax=Tropicimonas isoalkanivorans TaxID=441112 RepID=A0A1I1GE18_9RHOB|nr:DUF302 domain-containing protein [Tropicimonas isoalkanivorans]SFC07360.1 protein of unknown function DUF302 [Tropicimonas isoalkanivorans]